MTTVSLANLNIATRANFIAALADIYEHAPWVAEAVAERRPFDTLAGLHAAMSEAVRSAPAEQGLALIKGHPDLAGKAARAGSMTIESKAEQASAGLDQLSDQEFEQFHRLNDAYRKKFGIPFIVCVRRHTKDSILRQFELRLHHDATTELDAALSEIGRITALRLDQRVETTDRLKVYGRLSTHILDTHGGRPAPDVRIELLELSANGQSRSLVATRTNQDGRTDQPLIGGRPVPIGRYELRFHIGTYFFGAGAALADPPFLDVVPIQFSVAEPEAHYHVPLLATPWSYTTYRGS